jgi:hypothetical protein
MHKSRAYAEEVLDGSWQVVSGGVIERQDLTEQEAVLYVRDKRNRPAAPVFAGQAQQGEEKMRSAI